jgi:hypothetical protein
LKGRREIVVNERPYEKPRHGIAGGGRFARGVFLEQTKRLLGSGKMRKI